MPNWYLLVFHRLFFFKERKITLAIWGMLGWENNRLFAVCLLDFNICKLLRGHSMLRNAVGGGRVSAFLEKSVTKVYGSTLLALQGRGWVSNSRKKALCNTLMAQWEYDLLFAIRLLDIIVCE